MSDVLPVVVLDSGAEAVTEEVSANLPAIALPQVPAASMLWSRALVLASIVVTLFTLDQITALLANYWLFESLDFQAVFWTNFWEGTWLYLIGFALFFAAVAVPAFMHRIQRRTRRTLLKFGFLMASVAALIASQQYLEFLLGGNGITPDEGFNFFKVDPVFGIDLGFYVFNLPNIWIAWNFVFWASILMAVVSVGCANAMQKEAGIYSSLTRLGNRVGISSTFSTRLAVAIFGAVCAIGVWLTRFGLLFKDNKSASVMRGAQYIDINGVFSNLNYINVSTVVILLGTGILYVMLRHLNHAALGFASDDWRPDFRKLGFWLLTLVCVDFSFKGLVVLRDIFFVRPNQPVIQLPYIARHVEATRAAYQLGAIQEIPFMPNVPGDPMPDADKLMASPTLKNAPLWPGFSSYLERWLDRQHSQRILQTGNPMVYGPTLEVFQQQQKLRTYYNFINVDSVRYKVGGEEKMFVSGVRETPLYEPVPWLAYWGQRFMLFTHGWGMVMAPAGEVNRRGEPNYASYDIPSKVKWPELAVKNERVYYGEGAATMAFSNVDRMKELDYPTDQDRAEIVLPEDVKAGIRMDSVLKRLVLGWRSRKFFDLVFSDLIKDTTRAHYFRTPIDRLAVIAPFLFYDSNPYAVNVDGRITWMVNAMTTANYYPYSLPEELGDKSDERSPFPREERMVNYLEDSVKCTVDASTGQLKFYKIKDSPVAHAMQVIYPTLFTPAEKMPAGVQAQLTYPIQMFHIQFDDLFIYYHMRDPMYFFNMEDMWDDADEVLGPILDSGKAITFSFEPYAWLAETGGALPPSVNKVQYTTAMAFTPEKALNLRAIPLVYQDPPDYGKISVLEIPKGRYVIGPEQADAAIDQEPYISQNFSWWTRKGLEVIRGHTTPLIVGKEIIYVEPIFLRSQQNPIPQLKKVCVVFRGTAYMADTLELAIRDAVAGRIVPSEKAPVPDDMSQVSEQAQLQMATRAPR